MPKKSRITLDDVAKQAGVSRITASRALRHSPQVSKRATNAVMDAAKLLAYIPNRAASTLASAKSHSIGIIIPSISNIVFSDVVRAIDDVLLPEGYQILIGNTRYSLEEEEKLIRTFLERSPDGMIVTGLNHTETGASLLKSAGVPIVQIMEAGENIIDMNVGFSHFQAGIDITQHLLEKGYKNIAFIGSQMDARTQQRLEGYKKAMETQRLSSENRVVTSPASSTVRLGGELLGELLVLDNKIDAVFCCNDDLAMGAIFECQRRNIKIPEQLAIAGFNDLEPSSSLNPAMTTVATPRYEIGEIAAQMLLKRMNNKEPEKSIVDVGYEIVVRSST